MHPGGTPVGRRRRPSRLRLPRRERRLRGRLPRRGARLRRPQSGGDRGDGRQGARAASSRRGRVHRRFPGTEGTASIDEALEVAGEIGYPVLIKAAAGGGGRGIRAARAEEELAELARAGRDGGRRRVRRRVALPREAARRRASRRGAGARRRARQPDPPLRARVLAPAPAAEAARGVAVSCARRRHAQRHDRRRAGHRRAQWATRTRARSSSCSTATGASTSSR